MKAVREEDVKPQHETGVKQVGFKPGEKREGVMVVQSAESTEEEVTGEYPLYTAVHTSCRQLRLCILPSR